MKKMIGNIKCYFGFHENPLSSRGFLNVSLTNALVPLEGHDPINVNLGVKSGQIFGEEKFCSRCGKIIYRETIC